MCYISVLYILIATSQIKQMTFVILGQANAVNHNGLQLPPFYCKTKNFITFVRLLFNAYIYTTLPFLSSQLIDIQVSFWKLNCYKFGEIDKYFICNTFGQIAKDSTTVSCVRSVFMFLRKVKRDYVSFPPREFQGTFFL